MISQQQNSLDDNNIHILRHRITELFLLEVPCSSSRHKRFAVTNLSLFEFCSQLMARSGVDTSKYTRGRRHDSGSAEVTSPTATDQSYHHRTNSLNSKYAALLGRNHRSLTCAYSTRNVVVIVVLSPKAAPSHLKR